LSARLDPLSILLVDDRAENLLVLDAVLSSPSYRLVQARSGAEALEAVAQNDFGMILLDIQMPVMDGFETARHIRDSARGKDVPIIFVTALDRDPRHVERGYKLGAVDFVFKPYEPLALRAKVNLLADLHRKNTELTRSQEKLRESEIRFRQLVQGVTDYAIFMLDPQGYIESWNEGAKRNKGYEANEVIGKHFSIFYPKEVARSGHPQRELEVAIRDSHYKEENWRIRKDGSRFWASILITAIRDDLGNLLGFTKVTRDLTERKHAEESLREANEDLEKKVKERTVELEATLRERVRENQHVSFLSEASALLASSLDYRETLTALARLSVPVIADWCTVTIVEKDRSKKRAAATHRDPSKSALIDEFSKYYPVSADEDAGVGYVVRTGKSFFTPVVEDLALIAAARDERHLTIMRELGCRSCIIAPLKVRGKVLGAISLVSSQSGRIYNTNDLALAEELGRRAGAAIDNALLFEASQSAIRSREEFVSIASHELKTPLTTLRLHLELTHQALSAGDVVASRLRWIDWTAS
jgi:PAS domain S-box-containing protein